MLRSQQQVREESNRRNEMPRRHAVARLRPLSTQVDTKNRLFALRYASGPGARIEVIFDMGPISFSFEQSDHVYTPQEICQCVR
jgi:hypothetical protein